MKKKKEIGVDDFIGYGAALGGTFAAAQTFMNKGSLQDTAKAGAVGAVGGTLGGAAFGFLHQTAKRAFTSVKTKPKEKGDLRDLL